MSRLSQEEKLDLFEILGTPGFKVLIKELESANEDIAQAVLKFDLGAGDERQLVRLKCRSEGSAQLLRAIKRTLESLRQGQKV